MVSDPYVDNAPQVTQEMPFHAQKYHDEVARTLLRMNNGHITVEEGLQAIMATSMVARNKLGEGAGLVLPTDRADLVSRHFESIVADDPNGAIPTCMPCLDNILLGGLPPGEVAIVAGLPGSGKSVVLQQFAEAAALEGYNVVFIAAEMKTIQLTYRTLARVTGIDSTRIRLNELDDQERETVRREIENLRAMNIAYKDAGDFSTTGIYEAILEAQRELPGRRVDLVVADYIQILQDDKGSGNENSRLETISRALKAIAVQFNVPVLVGSQINRESVKAGTRPGLHHLRGSGGPGQDASIVLLLYPDYDPDAGVEKSDEEKVTIIVEKNRNGRAGLDIICTFVQSQQVFREWGARHQGEAGRGVLAKQAKKSGTLAAGGYPS